MNRSVNSKALVAYVTTRSPASPVTSSGAPWRHRRRALAERLGRRERVDGRREGPRQIGRGAHGDPRGAEAAAGDVDDLARRASRWTEFSGADRVDDRARRRVPSAAASTKRPSALHHAGLGAREDGLDREAREPPDVPGALRGGVRVEPRALRITAVPTEAFTSALEPSRGVCPDVPVEGGASGLSTRRSGSRLR